MNARTATFYVLGLAATAGGIWMLVDDGEASVRAAAVAQRKAVVDENLAALKSGQGGYMGTGRAQVTVEEGAKPVAAPAESHDERAVQTRQDMDGERRAEELKRVLANIDGEPVYVEGVDGPLPEKKKAPKR